MTFRPSDCETPYIIISENDRSIRKTYSVFYSPKDPIAIYPTPSLLKLCIKTIEAVPSIDLTNISSSGYYKDSPWPREPYTISAALVKVLQPKTIIEIGAYGGLSALCFKRYHPTDGKIVTFDVVPWQNIKEAVFKDSDFLDGKLISYVDDLTDPKTMEKYSEIIQSAQLIYIDAQHDGLVEQKLWQLLQQIPFSQTVYFLFDDIHLPAMRKFWGNLPIPKLDLTYFGNPTGTGIAELSVG